MRESTDAAELISFIKGTKPYLLLKNDFVMLHYKY